MSGHDFEEVHSALAATAKGRAFLREYAERARPDDTKSLFTALGRIEESLSLVRDSLKPAALANDLNAIAETIANLAANGPKAIGSVNSDQDITISVDEIEKITLQIKALASALDSGSDRRAEPDSDSEPATEL
ncbi:MAG: hypothetical protein ACTSSQ_00450 [Alphaproteobacteria bacterium]